MTFTFLLSYATGDSALPLVLVNALVSALPWRGQQQYRAVCGKE